MKLLYLYVEDFRSLKNIEFNLDSNERFHYDGRTLSYERLAVLTEGFFSIDSSIKTVEDVSAIVGANGSGKTSFATILNYIFVLGRPSPKYICVCKIDNKYIAFENLVNTPDDGQVKSVLGASWDFRSKTMNRDAEGCPFEVLYYSPFFHTRFVWNDRNCWCHDISATWSMNTSIGRIMGEYFNSLPQEGGMKKKGPDSPIESMNQNLNIARIIFLHKFSALPEAKRKSIPFPLSLFVEIKPNIDLFIGFEGYLHRLTENNIDSPIGMENIREIRRLGEYYTTSDPFRSLLIAFTIYMAQFLGYERLGPQKCPDIRDLIDLCASQWGYDKVSHALKCGWELCGRRSAIDQWKYINRDVFIEFLSQWKFLYDKHVNMTMGAGIRIPIKDKDTKSDIITLLHLHEKLTFGKGRFISTDPSEMSSGECAYLNMFALLYDRINASHSAIKGPLLLAIDEAETTLHPLWQRQMVYNVIWFFENFAKDCSPHIIFMTHSPMLLSDIPIGNCVFLCRNEGEADSHVEDIEGHNDDRLFVNTFGANIFDMYYHPFFMKDGTIGKFALQKIEKALANKGPEGAEIAKLTGDPFLRGMLLDELGENNPSKGGALDLEFSYEPYIDYPQE